MPELRKDPVSDEWVVIAPERGKRPSDFLFKVSLPPGKYCPFCPGHEVDTPGEVYALRDGGSPNDATWRVRVVPNRFPALIVEEGWEKTAEGLYDRVSGVGAHEVVIETPDHAATLATVPRQQLEDVLWSWRERIVDLGRDVRLRYVQIFKNHGPAAGATLEHEHSQIVALPVVPGRVAGEMDRAARWFAEKERCLFCDIMRQDRREGSRLVYENEEIVALCPYASRTPFLVRLYPRTHRGSFESIPRAQMAPVADALQTVLRKMDEALEKPAHNLVLHTHVLREENSPSYHWHLDLAPALTRPGGFELGTGSFLNPTPPEEAAEFLRRTVVR